MKKLKKIKILLTNRTKYSSRDLKKLFSLVVERYRRSHFDYKWTSVHVTCVYRRIKDGFCGGYAYYDSNFITMKLPKVKGPYGSQSFEQRIATTFDHELDHNRGLMHKDMKEDKHRDVSYVTSDIQVNERKPKEKAKPTVDDKIVRMQERVKKWVSKQRRAERAIKVLNKKIKYYQKKAA